MTPHKKLSSNCVHLFCSYDPSLKLRISFLMHQSVRQFLLDLLCSEVNFNQKKQNRLFLKNGAFLSYSCV